MSRIQFAADILRPLSPESILDVGCRDGSLADLLPDADYAGADLRPGPRVTYVGDVTRMALDRRFDAVVALDILEHLENPSEMFDRLVPLAARWLLISLPNSYDLKSRIQFATKGHLGGKYVFSEVHPQDRHRWLMSRTEIQEFARAKARKHGLAVRLIDMTFGSSGEGTLAASAGRFAAAMLPRSLSTATVFALFENHRSEGATQS